MNNEGKQPEVGKPHERLLAFLRERATQGGTTDHELIYTVCTMRGDFHLFTADIQAVCETHAQQQQEITRLREALQQIYDNASDCDPVTSRQIGDSWIAARSKEIAEEALQTGEGA